VNSRTKIVVPILLLSLCLPPFPLFVHSAELSPGVRAEIDHLMAYMETSGCRFYRNGTWYVDPKAVREHVETKYRYFMGKGRINSTEDFIKWSATKSEMSGKPYLVKCGDGSEEPLSQWLTDELNRYRKAKPAGPR
jgi:hypothetical protein